MLLKTPADGANAERKAIRAWLKRNPQWIPGKSKTLLEWLDSRTKRYNPKPGGLGKKKKPGPVVRLSTTVTTVKKPVGRAATIKGAK